MTTEHSTADRVRAGELISGLIRVASMSESEDVALKEFEETYRELDIWDQRAREVRPPATGSPLQIDDLIWPRHGVSVAAWNAMLAGVDHLKLVRLAIDSRTLFPTALHSVLRSGLIAAAQAVWVLAPTDSAERQRNALGSAKAFYEHLMGANRAVRFRAVDPDHADRDWDDHKARRDAVMKLGARMPDTTRIVELAARHVFGDTDLVRETMLIWHSTSGDAHASTAQLTMRSHSVGPRVGDLHEHSIGGDLEDIVYAHRCCFVMLQFAWARFDALSRVDDAVSEAPESPPE